MRNRSASAAAGSGFARSDAAAIFHNREIFELRRRRHDEPVDESQVAGIRRTLAKLPLEKRDAFLSRLERRLQAAAGTGRYGSLPDALVDRLVDGVLAGLMPAAALA